MPGLLPLACPLTCGQPCPIQGLAGLAWVEIPCGPESGSFQEGAGSGRAGPVSWPAVGGAARRRLRRREEQAQRLPESRGQGAQHHSSSVLGEGQRSLSFPGEAAAGSALVATVPSFPPWVALVSGRSSWRTGGQGLGCMTLPTTACSSRSLWPLGEDRMPRAQPVALPQLPAPAPSLPRGGGDSWQEVPGPGQGLWVACQPGP